MPTPLIETVPDITSLSEPTSNKDFTAETASETVMAEQISHNVVNTSESTGASALVDVAANQTITASADLGNYDDFQAAAFDPETQTDMLDASQTANEQALQANAVTSSLGTELPTSTFTDKTNDATTIEDSNVLPTDMSSEPVTTDYPHLVNGTYDALTPGEGPVDDGSLREGSVDVSLNSDTEESRGDASEVKKDEIHHIRTNSVKKPLTFSKVSVAKNFLAKSATATPLASKPGDKPSAAGTPPQPSAAKPRLIAKTGPSLRDVQKARVSAEATAGPDASKVWNKNRRMYKASAMRDEHALGLMTSQLYNHHPRSSSPMKSLSSNMVFISPPVCKQMKTASNQSGRT